RSRARTTFTDRHSIFCEMAISTRGIFLLLLPTSSSAISSAAVLAAAIVKNKLFFFGAYQGTQLRNVTQANSATVPTAAQRAGDFSSIPVQLVNPFTAVPFPSNQVPVADFAPASAKLLTLIPPAIDSSGVIQYSSSDNEHENQFLTRADYDLNKHRIYGGYFFSRYGRDAVIPTQNILSPKTCLDLFYQGAAVGDT